MQNLSYIYLVLVSTSLPFKLNIETEIFSFW